MKKRTLLIVALVTLGLVAAIAGFAPAAPSIYGISPTNCYQNSAAFTLTVGGYNFVSGSTILWNGSPRTTNFVSTRVLNAQISTTDVSTPGLFPVSVKNPDNQVSNALNFRVLAPVVPKIYSLSPIAIVTGGGNFDLTVNGIRFQSTSKVLWDGFIRTTTFTSSRQLHAAILQSDIATVGNHTISVNTPGAGGGTSNMVRFAVVRKNVSVLIQGFAFSPRDLTVVKGETVIFTHNDGTVPHTVTRDITTSPGPDSPTMAQGDTYSFAITDPVAVGANIFYHCQFHGSAGNGTTFGAGMTGVIRVR